MVSSKIRNINLFEAATIVSALLCCSIVQIHSSALNRPLKSDSNGQDFILAQPDDAQAINLYSNNQANTQIGNIESTIDVVADSNSPVIINRKSPPDQRNISVDVDMLGGNQKSSQNGQPQVIFRSDVDPRQFDIDRDEPRLSGPVGYSIRKQDEKPITTTTPSTPSSSPSAPTSAKPTTKSTTTKSAPPSTTGKPKTKSPSPLTAKSTQTQKTTDKPTNHANFSVQSNLFALICLSLLSSMAHRFI